MDSIGVIRRVDEIGRIVIPKEIRNGLKIKSGDCLEVFSDGNNIFMKKKELIKSSIDTLNSVFKVISDILNISILITDTSKYIYSVDKEYDNRVDDIIPDNLYENIIKRKTIIVNNYIINNQKVNIIIEPLIVNGDILGSILFISKSVLKPDILEPVLKIIIKLLINHIEL